MLLIYSFSKVPGPEGVKTHVLETLQEQIIPFFIQTFPENRKRECFSLFYGKFVTLIHHIDKNNKIKDNNRQISET